MIISDEVLVLIFLYSHRLHAIITDPSLKCFCLCRQCFNTVKPDLLNVKGLEQLMNTIRNVKTKWCFNPRLFIEGILFTQVDTRRNNDREFINLLGFVFMGGLLVYGYLSLNSQERDGGMLGAGIVFLIMGLFLLAGVVYTLIKIYKPNDENVKTDKNHLQEGIIK